MVAHMRRFLAYFAHGPLMFWLVGTVGLGALFGFAYTTGRHSPDPAPPKVGVTTMRDDVLAWRSALGVLPIVATSDDQNLIIGVGTTLGRSAHSAGERAREAGWSTLADMWDEAERAALELADVDVADHDRLVAAAANVAVAGDRLVSVALAYTSPEMVAVRGIPLGGQASGISGTGTWTGAGTPAQPEGATNGPADTWMQQHLP